MPSTYSLRFKYELPATGELSGTWGTTVNNAITNLLDETIDAISDIAMANADQTLSIPNGLSSPNRARTLRATGAHTAIRTLTVPSGNGTFRVINATTGGFAINVKTPTSTSIALPAGQEGYFIAQGSTLTLSSPYFNALSSISANITSLNASFVDGTASVPSINFASDTDTGIYRVGANSLGFSVAGANAATMTANLLSLVGSMSLNRTAASVSVNLNTSDPRLRNVVGQTNGLFRWSVTLGDNVAEGGSNAGSNFAIGRYDDAGTALSFNALSINRATGNVGINNVPLTDTRLYVAHQAAEAVQDAKSIRVLNGNAAANASANIEFAVGAGVLRGQIIARRDGATADGSLLLCSASGGFPNAVLTLLPNLNATFSGTVTATGFITLSDRSAKTEIAPFDLGLEAIARLEPATFKMKKDTSGRRHVGLIAQDVQHTPLGQHMVHDGPDGMLALEPNVVIYALINSVKELRAEIMRLKGYP